MNPRMTMQRPYPYHQNFVPQQMQHQQRPQRLPVGGMQQSILGQYQPPEPFIPPQSFPYNPQMSSLPFPYVGAEQIIGPNPQQGFSMMFNPEMTYLMCIPMHFDGRSQIWNCQNGIIVSPHMATNIAGYNVTYHTVQQPQPQPVHNGYGPAPLAQQQQQPGSPNGSGNSFSTSSNENLNRIDGSPQHGVNSTPQPTCGVAPYVGGQPAHGPGYNPQIMGAVGGVGTQPPQQVIQPGGFAHAQGQHPVHQNSTENRGEGQIQGGSPVKMAGSNTGMEGNQVQEKYLDGQRPRPSLSNSFDSGEVESADRADHQGQMVDVHGVPRSDSLNSETGFTSDGQLETDGASMRRDSSGALIVESQRELKSQQLDHSSVRSSPLNASDMRSGGSPISMVARDNSRTSTPLTKQFIAGNGPRGSPSPVNQVPDGRASSQSLTGFSHGTTGNDATRGSRPPSSALPLANGTVTSPVNPGAAATPPGSEPQGKMSWARVVGSNVENGARGNGGASNQPYSAAGSAQNALWNGSKQSLTITATPKTAPVAPPPQRPPQPQTPWTGPVNPSAAYPARRPGPDPSRQFEYPRLKREEAEAYPDEQQIYIPPFPREISKFGDDLVDVRQRLMGNDQKSPRMCYVLFKSSESVQSLLRQRTIKIGEYELPVQAKPREPIREPRFGNGAGGYRR